MVRCLAATEPCLPSQGKQEVEEWRGVVGFEGLYEVSSIGRVRGCPRNVPHAMGNLNLPGRILRPSISPGGYYVAILSKNGIRHSRPVHRLVGIAFIPNPNNLPQINHISGIKTDNSVGNIEWCDQSHNNKHAYAAGLNKGVRGMRWKQVPGKSWGTRRANVAAKIA